MQTKLSDNALFVFERSGIALSGAIQKGYKKGLRRIVDLNIKNRAGTVLRSRFASERPFGEEFGNGKAPPKDALHFGRSANLFKISYSDADRLLLKNFEVEAFTVAGVMQYECEEELKDLASLLTSGQHPALINPKGRSENPEQSIEKIWESEAYNVLAHYVDLDDFPPPSVLNTNLRTAINSSYHAAEWQRIQELRDVYPYMRYMTQDDGNVRDEHAKLHGKIFRSDDPIWDVIYPPNGWNCRCYIEPLTSEEAGEGASDIIPIADKEQREALINDAAVHKDFARNSGKTGSIWGKWLKSKLEGKVYEEITGRMRDATNTMPDADLIVEALKKNAAPYRDVELTRENFDKDFPQNIVKTPIGEFKLGEDQYDKLRRNDRGEIAGLIKPVLEQPDFIFVDAESVTVFIKGFSKRGSFIVVSILKDKSGTPLVVSTHRKSDNNVKNKIKGGKFPVYSRFKQPPGGGSTDDTFTQNAGSLNFADANIVKTKTKFNEVWGKFIKPGKTAAVGITYRVEGFEFVNDKGETGFENYKNIDKYRDGVLIL